MSPVNDGRLMKYPPERVLPAVSGSHDWMREQLESLVAERLDLDQAVVVPELGGGEIVPFPEVFLVPTRQTAVDYRAGRSPVYQIVVSRDGIMERVDEIRFDPTSYQIEAREAFESERAQAVAE